MDCRDNGERLNLLISDREVARKSALTNLASSWQGSIYGASVEPEEMQLKPRHRNCEVALRVPLVHCRRDSIADRTQPRPVRSSDRSHLYSLLGLHSCVTVRAVRVQVATPSLPPSIHPSIQLPPPRPLALVCIDSSLSSCVKDRCLA